tara:strand:+ start:1610 stop:1723 length:114 start_codon:yes stop_codon:yes gene_type:complete
MAKKKKSKTKRSKAWGSPTKSTFRGKKLLNVGKTIKF